ncbi:unnamed protein product [Moneuplotes crassus]|uniref:Uncharacterized protein n=1 Tax=Euplotes crassus TaxID=5936 RepID=A0AAD2DA21_EUPCR|nr:unnamed protein product [Moneuplotes crassus]
MEDSEQKDQKEQKDRPPLKRPFRKFVLKKKKQEKEKEKEEDKSDTTEVPVQKVFICPNCAKNYLKREKETKICTDMASKIHNRIKKYPLDQKQETEFVQRGILIDNEVSLKDWCRLCLMEIQEELDYRQLELNYYKLYEDNNYIVTKKDKLITDENEAYYTNKAKNRVYMRPIKVEKYIRWKFLIYIDNLQGVPKSFLDPNAVHFLHLKYCNRRVIFKLDTAMNSKHLSKRAGRGSKQSKQKSPRTPSDVSNLLAKTLLVSKLKIDNFFSNNLSIETLLQ